MDAFNAAAKDNKPAGPDLLEGFQKLRRNLALTAATKAKDWKRCEELVIEGAAAAPVAALLQGLITMPKGSRVVAVLSGGNLNLDQLRGLRWN